MSSFSRGYFQLANGVEQAFDNVLFIEDWQLHSDSRQLLEVGCGVDCSIFLVLVIEINQNVAVHSVSGKKNENNKIRN